MNELQTKDIITGLIVQLIKLTDIIFKMNNEIYNVSESKDNQHNSNIVTVINTLTKILSKKHSNTTIDETRKMSIDYAVYYVQHNVRYEPNQLIRLVNQLYKVVIELC